MGVLVRRWWRESRSRWQLPGAGAAARRRHVPIKPSRDSSSASLDARALQFPAGWTSSWDAAAADFRELRPAEQGEVDFIQRMMDETFEEVSTRDRKGRPMPKRLRAKNVQRIENSPVWRRYAEGRESIRQKTPRRCTPIADLSGAVVTMGHFPPELGHELEGQVNEVMLWHGTSPAGAQGIIANGFRTSFAGSHAGTMYGSGLYFAEASSKSDEYATDAKDGAHKGLCCLLLCRVVLGEAMHLTAGGSATYGMIKAGIEGGAYDSVLGDRKAFAGTYREFVVYEGDQVYPAYVILYQREH
mmetsp:Transcript_101439/g.327346  ORF Transcript_101439/g.327346 Transcript_101439/m.327346 type:complete len:301 (+) Transcript_101439:2-904(+)